MNQDVLRFVLIGPPRRAPSSIRLSLQLSGIGTTLLALSQSDDGRSRATEFARAFLDGAGFGGDPSRLPMGRQFRALANVLASQRTFTAESLERNVETAFGEPATQVFSSPEFRTHVQRLADGILALTLAPRSQPTMLEQYVRQFRVADLVMKVAESADDLAGLRFATWSRVPLELPPEVFPLKGKGTAATVEASKAGGDDLQKLDAKLAALDDAAEELLEMGSEDLRIVEDAPKEANDGSDLLAVRARLAGVEEAVRSLAARESNPAETAAVEEPESSSLLALVEARSRLFLKETAITRLSPAVRSLLAELDIAPESVALDTAIRRVEQESDRIERAIEALLPSESAPSTVRLGTTTISTELLDAPAPPPQAVDDFTAPTAENLGMLGVGSLLITNMQILRYEAGEVAHIENVLIGETKERETRRLRRTEETTVREIETTKEEERDVQTADRNEIGREMTNTVKESEQFKIGGSISASYGPFVQATVTTEFATDSSVEDVARNASTYARELTERTTSKITERVREEQTIRVIQEFEERNLHRLDGSGRDEHIIGIFQWVDKVYQAQVYDYGARLICNLRVPDPGRFLQQAVLKVQQEQEGAITPPDPLNFGPKKLTPSNYMKYVKKYKAKGVSAPPERVITLSATFKKPQPEPVAEGEEESGGGSETPVTTFTETRDQAIPNGYRAIEAYATASSIDANPKKGGIAYGLRVHVGRALLPFVNPDDEGSVIKGELTASLDDEVGSIPIMLIADNVTDYAAAVEIKCHRTTTALRKWQLQTYEAIVDAHGALEAEYRERLSEAAAQEGIVIEGRNPEENRRLERTELKRLALSMITRQHFSGFGAYLNTVPVPHIDFDKAFEQGKFIKFCEDAFEWENLLWELESYFWSNKNRWAKKLLATDVDPLHAAFHAAGSAKVQVPLRPDYEAAFFYYLNTGLLWEGAELPPVVTAGQSALLAQLLERRETEGSHQRIPVGEPWEVRLPTTLVRVSPGAELPRWEQDENGNWQPVA